MAFRKIHYGEYRLEIKKLMRKRLSVLDKIRYHQLKAKELDEQIPILQHEINRLLRLANGKRT